MEKIEGDGLAPVARATVDGAVFTYDSAADALYVLLSKDTEPAVARTVELDDQLHVDLNEEGAVVGVEILYPRMGLPDLLPLRERFGIHLELPFSFAA